MSMQIFEPLVVLRVLLGLLNLTITGMPFKKPGLAMKNQLSFTTMGDQSYHKTIG